jgi:hypothetical protein
LVRKVVGLSRKRLRVTEHGDVDQERVVALGGGELARASAALTGDLASTRTASR